MKVGDLGKFKDFPEPYLWKGCRNQMFFISRIDREQNGIEITLFKTGERWFFDRVEIKYYTDIFCP